MTCAKVLRSQVKPVQKRQSKPPHPAPQVGMRAWWDAPPSALRAGLTCESVVYSHSQLGLWRLPIGQMSTPGTRPRLEEGAVVLATSSHTSSPIRHSTGSNWTGRAATCRASRACSEPVPKRPPTSSPCRTGRPARSSKPSTPPSKTSASRSAPSRSPPPATPVFLRNVEIFGL